MNFGDVHGFTSAMTISTGFSLVGSHALGMGFESTIAFISSMAASAGGSDGLGYGYHLPAVSYGLRQNSSR